MKDFIRNYWGWLLMIVVLLGFVVFITATVERRNVGGVIVEHNVTASSSGHRTYSTIVKTDDGYIEEKTGLELYTIPVGNRVTIEVTRTKQKKY
jgi:predicted O-methyltransferase YrrM